MEEGLFDDRIAITIAPPHKDAEREGDGMSATTVEAISDLDPLEGYFVHCGECNEDSEVAPYPSYWR